MSGEAQRGNEDGRLESSPCSLWQSEQEALSKVSVHSQKAAAELQATARWLYRRVGESRGTWRKGEEEHEKFGLLDQGSRSGGSAALFYSCVMSVSQFWAAVASLIIWQQIETVQP